MQAKAERHVREAALQGANIILLQELFGKIMLDTSNCTRLLCITAGRAVPINAPPASGRMPLEAPMH